MPIVLTINAGSSSVRLSLEDSDGETARTIGGRHEKAHPADRAETIRGFLAAHGSQPPAAARRMTLFSSNES